MFKFGKGVGTIASIAAIVLMMNAPAWAQSDAWSEHPRSRVGFFGGGSFTSSERTFIPDPLDPDRDQFSTKLTSGGVFGLRGTYDLTPNLAIDGILSFGSSDLLVTELTETPVRTRKFGISKKQFAGSLLYFVSPPGSKIRPFVTGGLGISRYNPTDKAKIKAFNPSGSQNGFFIEEQALLVSSNKPSFNFGGGAEVMLTPNFGVRIDFQDYISGIPRFGVPQTNPGGEADFYPVDGSIHNIVFSVGILYFME